MLIFSSQLEYWDCMCPRFPLLRRYVFCLKKFSAIKWQPSAGKDTENSSYKRNLENLVSQIKDPVSEIDNIHFIKESYVLYRRVSVSQVSVRSQVSAVSFRRHCESRSVTLSHKVPPRLQESHSWKSRQHPGLA